MTCKAQSKQCGVQWRAHKYQQKAVKHLRERDAAALFLDPGLGKTAITLEAFVELQKKGEAKKALVIAPLRVCYAVWPTEVKKWAQFSHLRVAVLHGPAKEAALQSDADIYVVNPEGLDWLLGAVKQRYSVVTADRRTGIVAPRKRVKVAVDVKAFAAMGFDTLVIDELSKFKHTGTARFKALKQVLPTFKRRWGLTGSPAANGLMDLFGQCYVLDMGKALGPYITRFQMTYFNRGWNGYSWELKEGAEQVIYRQIGDLALRIGNEVLDMPELVHHAVRVQLPPKVVLLYRKLERDLLLGLDSGTVTAATAAALSMKCRQVSSGAVYLDPEMLASGLLKVGAEKKWAELHDVKMDALRELVDELQGQPLLVANEFEHEVERLRKALPDAVFASDYSAGKWPGVVERWNRGEIRVLVAHPASVGHGNNMQACACHVCWLNPTWNLELHDQFLARVWRQGNKASRCFNHFIIAEGTIDELVYVVLQGKDRDQKALFSALKAYRKAS